MARIALGLPIEAGEVPEGAGEDGQNNADGENHQVNEENGEEAKLEPDVAHQGAHAVNLVGQDDFISDL